MKLRNPYHVDPVILFVNNNKATIDNYLNSNYTKEFIDFDEIRAAFPNSAEFLTDGMICEILKVLNIQKY